MQWGFIDVFRMLAERPGNDAPIVAEFDW